MPARSVVRFRIPRHREGTLAKSFRLDFDELSDFGSWIQNFEDTDQGKEIIKRNLQDLFRYLVIPIYKSYAPRTTVSQHNKHLYETIRSVQIKDGLERELSMAGYGGLTQTGRGVLGSARGKAWPIHLPDGTVIFRKTIGPATTRSHKEIDPETGVPMENRTDAKWRMDWSKRAWYYLRDEGILQQAAYNIAADITDVLGDITLKTRYSEFHITDTYSHYSALRRRRTGRKQSGTYFHDRSRDAGHHSNISRQERKIARLERTFVREQRSGLFGGPAGKQAERRFRQRIEHERRTLRLFTS